MMLGKVGNGLRYRDGLAWCVHSRARLIAIPDPKLTERDT
jgi:hypothetical protein